jgi:hypothetical protein
MMIETKISSTFVSQVAPVGFADAADAVEQLSGQEIESGRVRLSVQDRIGEGLAGAVWYSGVLHTGSILIPAVKVDIVVSPWSAGRTEIGLRPLSRIGQATSLRASRFFDSAWALLPELVDQIAAKVPTGTEVPARVSMAA